MVRLPQADESEAAACGGCHGAPPADHASDVACATCHPATIGGGGALVTAAHLDGVLDVGDGSGACTGCHGGPAGPAPPRGLAGETLPAALAVGAHRAHLEAPSQLRAPIACTECHLVPAAVDDAGHLDSALPAEVFPAGAGVIARADDAVPLWDHGTGRCSDVYCHGGGDRLGNDLAPDRITEPTWTMVGDGQAACGRCHGLPPIDILHDHDPAYTIADCTTCHPSVDGFGSIVFTGPPEARTTLHLNGEYDLR